MAHSMTTLLLDEVETSRIALEERWRELATIIDEAKQLDALAKRDPIKLDDPWVTAHIRWLNLFEVELAAVQAVYDAVTAGAKLEASEIRSARIAADKLLEIIQTARSRMPQPA